MTEFNLLSQGIVHERAMGFAKLPPEICRAIVQRCVNNPSKEWLETGLPCRNARLQVYFDGYLHFDGPRLMDRVKSRRDCAREY